MGSGIRYQTATIRGQHLTAASAGHSSRYAGCHKIPLNGDRNNSVRGIGVRHVEGDEEHSTAAVEEHARSGSIWSGSQNDEVAVLCNSVHQLRQEFKGLAAVHRGVYEQVHSI